MKCILTSNMDLYDKDLNGNRIAKDFGNNNKILDNIKKYVKKYDNFLFVPDDVFLFPDDDKYKVDKKR